MSPPRAAGLREALELYDVAESLVERRLLREGWPPDERARRLREWRRARPQAPNGDSHSLSAEGYVVAAAVEQDAAGRLATVRMMSAAQADDVPLDVRGPIAATALSKAHGDAHSLRPRGE